MSAALPRPRPIMSMMPRSRGRMVDAIREVPASRAAISVSSARRAKAARPPAVCATSCPHGGELLGPRTEKADEALHARLRKARRRISASAAAS